jgi:dienelactone hydrolase
MQLTARLLNHTLTIGLLLVLSACSINPSTTWDQRMETRATELAQAIDMPDESQVRTLDLQWADARPPRHNPQEPRMVAARLHWPANAEPGQPLPLVVFSHGLGGSREGYSYLGKYWAAHGIASLHLQHAGSDRSIWDGPALGLVSRLQAAAQPAEALDRVLDVKFALDRMLQPHEQDPTPPIRVDANRIAMAGHSYGANTTLLIAGARPPLDGQRINLSDARVKAAIVISAPPFYGTEDVAAILQGARIPALHVTSTGDEITVPGYHSDPIDRIRVFDAYGGADKSLVVFKNGSHSMFTDRLNTGGIELNPQVKQATREATLAFLQRTLSLSPPYRLNWPDQHASIVQTLRWP